MKGWLQIEYELFYEAILIENTHHILEEKTDSSIIETKLNGYFDSNRLRLVRLSFFTDYLILDFPIDIFLHLNLDILLKNLHHEVFKLFFALIYFIWHLCVSFNVSVIDFQSDLKNGKPVFCRLNVICTVLSPSEHLYSLNAVLAKKYEVLLELFDGRIEIQNILLTDLLPSNWSNLAWFF